MNGVGAARADRSGWLPLSKASCATGVLYSTLSNPFPSNSPKKIAFIRLIVILSPCCLHAQDGAGCESPWDDSFGLLQEQLAIGL